MSAKFSFAFLSLLTALIVKSSHILSEIYFVFPKKCPRPNLKGLVKELGKWLSSKTNFSTFFKKTFRLKLCQKP